MIGLGNNPEPNNVDLESRYSEVGLSLKLKRRKQKCSKAEPISKSKSNAKGRAKKKSRCPKFSVNKPPKKLYKCAYWDKVFDQAPNLEYHIRIHTNEKPYKCDRCSYVARQISHIDVHKRTRGSIDDMVQCPNCEMKFCTVQSLGHHRRSIHEGKNPESRRRRIPSSKITTRLRSKVNMLKSESRMSKLSEGRLRTSSSTSWSSETRKIPNILVEIKDNAGLSCPTYKTPNADTFSENGSPKAEKLL